MTFRDRLMATLRQLRSVLEQPGVLVVGSEVPNLLQPNAASTLVVSQVVDLAVPIDSVAAVKRRLRDVEALRPSAEEPSVYVPGVPGLLEANFLGLDPAISEPHETYVLDDEELPLMVFGPLGLLRAGPIVEVEDLRVPLPRPADLIVEKLLTDRTGEKGARDLLVVAGMLEMATSADEDEVVRVSRQLSDESRHAIASSLTVLSLMERHADMPDPAPTRRRVKRLLEKLEAARG